MCMSVLAGVAGLSDHYQAKAEEGLLEGSQSQEEFVRVRVQSAKVFQFS